MKRQSLFVIMQITEQCNLRCKYCYVNKKIKADMPLKVAYRAFDYLKELRDRGDYESITICFHGGEPTVVFDRVKKMVSYARSVCQIDKFVMGTNGVKISDARIRYMMENKITPTISMDGIPQAQSENRPFANGKSSWERVDHTLDLFGKYIDFWKKKRDPDPFRIRITLTPSSVGHLAESVRLLINKQIGQEAAITIMPVMPSRMYWNRLLESGGLEKELTKQMLEIAAMYLERSKIGRPFDFCINECFTLGWSNFLKSDILDKAPYCGAGMDKIISISMDGGIYPCYLPSANPRGNQRFRMGNIYGGVSNKGAEKSFCGNKKSMYFSCLYWNILENGDPSIPDPVYKVIYESWKQAAEYIKKNFSEKDKEKTIKLHNF